MWTTLKRNPQYAVNERGEIYSLRKGRTLTPKANYDGYLRIQLWSANQCEYVSIHRLIAETFIPNPHNKPFVNHIDGNKKNNDVENLEWCTQKENIAHAWEKGLSHRPFNTCGKPVKQIDLKGKIVAQFASMMEAERVTGIPHSNISQAIARKGTAGGHRWEEVAHAYSSQL